MLVDTVTLAVIKGWLEQIVDEMDEVLCKSAFSPTISEGYDRANGIYRDNGDFIAQGKTGLPCFIQVMQDTVKAVIEAASAQEGINEGDIFMMNDPYFGGTHLMDVKFCKPYFRNGSLLYFLANTGHWPDIGGSSPGGFAFGARDIHQEGVRIPPIKLYSKGELNKAALTLLLANIRIPEDRLGDLKAQVGALRIGEERLNRLLEKYGTETVAACIDELEKRAETHMRSYIAEIPDSVYSDTRYIDNDGVDDKPIRICLDLQVTGSDICFDFSKSSPPSKGPINCSFSCVASACLTTLKHLFPDIPLNAGMLKPVRIIVPQNTFLNAAYPKAVAGIAQIQFRVVDVVSGALAQAVPEKLWADSCGTINNIGIGGEDPERGPYIMYLYTGGGYGGWKGGDGFTYGAPSMSISRVQPYEVFEQHYPVITRQFSIRESSGGAGKYRGGFGAVIEIEFLGKEAKISLLGDRGKFGPKGILGGGDGAKDEVSIIKKNGDKIVFPFLTKGEAFIEQGDLIQVKTPGGGGYGDPHERERELILKDVVKGFCTKEEAEKEYDILIQDEELEYIRKIL
ncbi:hydantoinase B/oxoprolinase family protein [Chloroflexota bacterium]